MCKPLASEPSTDAENALLEIFRADAAVLRQRAAKNDRALEVRDIDPALRGYARQAVLRRKEHAA